MKVKLLSLVQHAVIPGTAAYQIPLPLGFSRQEYWKCVAIAFSGDTSETISNAAVFELYGSQKKKRKRNHEKIIEVIIAEKFPNMEKEIVNQVQEAQRVPYRINPRRNMPRNILIKLAKIKHK